MGPFDQYRELRDACKRDLRALAAEPPTADRGDWRNAAHGYRDQRDELQRELDVARARIAELEADLAPAGWLHDPAEIERRRRVLLTWGSSVGEELAGRAARIDQLVDELNAAHAELAALRAVADPIETAAEAAQGELEEARAELAALRAVADAATALTTVVQRRVESLREVGPLVDLLAALDALPPADVPAPAPPPGEGDCNCQRNELGMVGTNSGSCPVHPLPGCPNPECGETWIKAFHGDRCDSCGWRGAAATGRAEGGCGELSYRQHPDTGTVQRVHADGTPHMPSIDPRCAAQAEDPRR